MTTSNHCDIIAVGNLKGGCGKTTVAVNLACAFAEQGRKTVLVDADPQQSAAVWARRGRLPAKVRSAPMSKLDEAGAWVDVLGYLSEHHELIVIDLPAVAAPALGMALYLARLAVIPTSCSPIDLHGAMRVRRHLEAARRERGYGAPAGLVAPVRLPPKGFARPADVEQRLARIGEPVAPPILQRLAHGEAFAMSDWVGAIAPGSPAHHEVRAFAERALDALAKAPTPPVRATVAVEPPRPTLAPEGRRMRPPEGRSSGLAAAWAALTTRLGLAERAA